MKDRPGKWALLWLALFVAQGASLAFVDHPHLDRTLHCSLCVLQATVEAAKTEGVVVFPQVVEFPRVEVRQERPAAAVFFLLRTRAPPA